MGKFPPFPLTTIVLILLSPLSITSSNGANILFYFGISTYSHRIVVWPLVRELNARGHHVTFLSPFPPKSPIANVTEFSPKSLQVFIDGTIGAEADMFKVRLDGLQVESWNGLQELGVGMCEALMTDPVYLKFVQESKFDLVIVDALNNECALGIVHQHRSSHIIMDTTHIFMWQPDLFGFSPEASWISDLAIGYPVPMSFTQRFYNELRPLLWYFGKIYDMYPRLEGIMNRGFNLSPENSIHLADLERNCSLILTNSHFSLDHARSLPPLVVPVGGLHLEVKSQVLPKELKAFIDGDEVDSFIYISFGSMAQVSKAKASLRNQLFYAIGNTTGCKFIWKWEGKTVPAEMPSNVYTAKWMPQSDILAHPKIKAFITHAGLLGIEEAILQGVPLIAFPMFAEQDYNAERLHRLGYGIRLEFNDFKQEHLQNAIQKVLTNSSYKEKMKEVSNIFKDRQVQPLETAVWWTEYVLRNKNNEYLMPLGRNLTWWSRRLLDVWGSIIGSFCLFLGILIGYTLSNRRSSCDQSKILNGNKKLQ